MDLDALRREATPVAKNATAPDAEIQQGAELLHPHAVAGEGLCDHARDGLASPDEGSGVGRADSQEAQRRRRERQAVGRRVGADERAQGRSVHAPRTGKLPLRLQNQGAQAARV